MDPLLSRITIDPEQNFGKPSIRGMGYRVQDVLAMMAAGTLQKKYWKPIQISILTTYEHALLMPPH